MLWGLFHSLLLVATAQAQDCPQAPWNPQDRRPDPSKLRVVAFNAEWLFSETSTKSPWTPEQAIQHLADVAQVVAKLRPDILSLEEVEDCTILKRLAEQVAQLGVPGYAPYMIKGTDTATGQNVGLLTLVDPMESLTRSSARADWPLPGSQCGFKGTPSNTAVSKHYQTKFFVNGMVIAMFGVHFIAIPTDPIRCVQREAQATIIREMVDVSLNNYEEVIVLGDFNDYSDAVLDYETSVPTSHVMKILRDGGAFLRNDTLNKTSNPFALNKTTNPFAERVSQAPVLLEVAGMVPQKTRYTSVYNTPSLYTSIDHILLSSRLANRASFSIYHEYADYAVSDHWPIIVDIDV